MLRRFLLYLSTAGWARTLTTKFPLARRVAERFVAGETLEKAISASQALNQKGLWVSLDYLGESVEKAEDTKEVVDTYSKLIQQIHAHQLQANVSLKLTHMGLDISEELCQTNLRSILSVAKPYNIAVTLDMESSDYTDRTLRIFRTMKEDYEFDNVTIVIQAYLYRSKEDMRSLASEGATVRLCKGAYLEPESVAFPAKADVDKQYVEIMDEFLNAPLPAYLQIASHDEQIITKAEALVKEKQLTPDRYEFQMLYGIRSARQESLVAAGHHTRVYVPFGEAWYPYFMRRLAERPANLWFFAKSLFSR